MPAAGYLRSRVSLPYPSEGEPLPSELDVVRSALLQSGVADLHECRSLMELPKSARSEIAHPGPQATDQLHQHFGCIPLKGHHPLHALRDDIGEIGLALPAG